MVETRNGSDLTIKQNVWGLTYIDELVQTSLNDDPADLTEQDCESNYYAMQDANYNVLGMTDEAGILVERYEYTPYGQRQVYTSSGLNDPQCYAPIFTSKPWQISGIAQPYSLNATGHQGLYHDAEINLIYNRARELHPTLSRFMQRDPLGYVDGMNVYEYVQSNPITRGDSDGQNSGEISVVSGPSLETETYKVLWGFVKQKGFMAGSKIDWREFDYYVWANRSVNISIDVLVIGSDGGTIEIGPIPLPSGFVKVSKELLENMRDLQGRWTGKGASCTMKVKCKCTCQCNGGGNEWEASWGSRWLLGRLEWNGAAGSPACVPSPPLGEQAKLMCTDAEQECRSQKP